MRERPKLNSRPPARIERRADNAQVHDDSAHLWAVSYADFLMVLLCFFIIFFSVDENQKESVIKKIFLTQEGSSGGPGNGYGTGAGPVVESRGVASKESGAVFSRQALEAALEDYSFSKFDNSEGLLVHFKDDLYEKGSFEISLEHKAQFNVFLEKVRPYSDQVSMTFIGHADADLVNPKTKKIYKDNFDLSAIRATRALQYAVRFGFPEEQVSAKGNSKNSRVTRSLSVLIKPKGELL